LEYWPQFSELPHQRALSPSIPGALNTRLVEARIAALSLLSNAELP
jgi:hypothetical protein